MARGVDVGTTETFLGKFIEADIRNSFADQVFDRCFDGLMNFEVFDLDAGKMIGFGNLELCGVLSCMVWSISRASGLLKTIMLRSSARFSADM